MSAQFSLSRILGDLFCGSALPTLLLLVGGFFCIYLKGRPFIRPKQMLRAMTVRKSGDGVSPFRAVTLALAGTLGVGNIVGVANAIWIGGAGAIFWMWISALFAMVLKYAEILLSVSHRRTARNGSHYGGAIYYIRDWFTAHGKHRTGMLLSFLFAMLMLLDALSMGCVIQVHAVSSALEGVLRVPPLLCGGLLLILTVPLLIRGARGISALTEYLIPILSGGYLLLSLAVLILRADQLPSVFSKIFQSAWTPESAGGGILGFLTARCLRVGTMRGLLSNEAGCGTAPTAHASAHTDSPAAQGIWGIFEVFVDTILLCTATALVILVSYPEVQGFGSNAVMMSIRAYSSVLGGWSDYFFCLAIFCFGYGTVICWANYAVESLRAVTSKKLPLLIFLLVLILCIPLGTILAPDTVWTLADFAIASLTEINLVFLILWRREIREETVSCFS